MNIPDSRAAARRPDWTTDADKYKIPVEPADPGPIHAWLHGANPVPRVTSSPIGRKDFAQLRRYILAQPGTALLEGSFVEAACGTRLRVIYRRPFDTNETDVCAQCVEMARLWQTDRAAYDQKVEERHQRWDDRDSEKIDRMQAAEQEREESYGSDPIDDDE